MSTKFTLHLDPIPCNQQYSDYRYEVAWILRDVANRIESGNILDINVIRDIAGNTIGTFSIHDDGNMSIVTV